MEYVVVDFIVEGAAYETPVEEVVDGYVLDDLEDEFCG